MPRACKFLLLIPALLFPACGLATYPLDNLAAITKNAQTIKFTASIVDEAGKPLDDVQVQITRNTQGADIWWPGDYTEPKKEPAITISKSLTCDTRSVCLKVTFTKPGYQSVTNYYANADDFAPDGRLVSLQQHFKCINVAKNSAPPVVMLKEAEISSR